MTDKYKPFMGKRLLILGASASEIGLVERAQMLGCFVFVTDYNTNWELSPAKKVADEVWDISWSDIPCLVQKCRESHIDGVVAGYSEFRVENLIKLCAALGLPCYCTDEQLEITRNKLRFKAFCRQYDLPVIDEVYDPKDVVRYPVIVKPVDRGGSIGISIATNEEEVIKSYEQACEASVCKRVVIEDYVTDGIKVDFYYSARNGCLDLMTTCDTVHSQKNGMERVVQNAWLYPTRTPSTELSKIDGKIRKMLMGLGVRNGCVAISGFLMKTGEIRLFECGFRLEGGCQYEYASRTGHSNYQDIFIYHALTGSCEKVPVENHDSSLKMVTVNLYAKGGTVGVIKGFDVVGRMPGCVLSCQHGFVGQTCSWGKSVLSKMGMFSFCSDSAGDIARGIISAYDAISILDCNGADMVYDRFDIRQLMDWWN